MPLQEKQINVIKEKWEDDPRISACMMYESFTKGEGDKYSDVKFYVYLKNTERGQFESSDWMKDIARMIYSFLMHHALRYTTCTLRRA